MIITELRCDHCAKVGASMPFPDLQYHSVDRGPTLPLGWIRADIHTENPTYSLDFCSEECVIAFFRKRRVDK